MDAYAVKFVRPVHTPERCNSLHEATPNPRSSLAAHISSLMISEIIHILMIGCLITEPHIT